MRLVPSQNPPRIIKSARQFLLKNCPSSIRLVIKSGHGAEPYIVSPTGRQAKAALRALRSAFGHTPVLMREGGSIPIVNDFKKYLHADTLLLGLALPDDNAHSPNEKFDLRCFAKGQLMSAYLWRELGR
jgi:acetylornithine deacetylase/succinyl-diaminopimelate desuccinylase-like protein